jgi:hypothetical protein
MRKSVWRLKFSLQRTDCLCSVTCGVRVELETKRLPLTCLEAADEASQSIMQAATTANQRDKCAAWIDSCA